MNFDQYWKTKGPFAEWSADKGKIGLPRIKLAEVSQEEDFMLRLFKLYSEVLNSTDGGAELLARLRADPRVSELNGKMISGGNSAKIFDLGDLAMWFLWRANEVGQQEAERDLDAWLNATEIDVTSALWVFGATADDVINLGDGYTLVPAKQMPASTDKERFLRFTMNYHDVRQPRPAAAITRRGRVQKCQASDPGESVSQDAEFFATSRKLHEIALVLNALSFPSKVNGQAARSSKRVARS